MRDVLIFLHILGVAGWLGGGIHSVFTFSAVADLEPEAAGAAIQQLNKREDRYFGPSLALVLLTGIGLVLTSDAYDWGDTFVLIGLGVFVVAAILNSTIGKRNGQRLVDAGAAGSGIREALKTWRRGSVWDFVILFVALWAMITKLGS